jgi:hypothetical protein
MLNPCDSGQPFTPYRVVIITTHANREAAWLSVAGIGADDVRRRMAEEPAVSTTDVADMFDGWIELLGWEVRRLADGLNIMRFTNHPQNAGPYIQVKRIDNALSELLGELPKLIASEREYISRGGDPKYIAEYRSAALDVFDGLLSATRQARNFLGRSPQKVRKAPWHSDALWIASFLTMVAKRAGRNVNFLQAHRPEVVLIESALCTAGVTQRNGGKEITADSIARAFARRKPQSIPQVAFT